MTAPSPLQQTVQNTPTDVWNDSCSVEELTYALEHGAVGATTNPNIVLDVLKKELPAWKDRIAHLIRELPTASEVEITWKLIEEMAVKGAGLLHPVFVREQGKKGRLSIQTNPNYFRNAPAIVEQAVYFHGLAPNMQVKIPATQAGVQAIEEVTFRGVNINATVSFCVPQVLAVAEAVERGLQRREATGQSTAGMTPVCTLMMGRLDDWMQVVVDRDGIVLDPSAIPWAGVACFKKAYGIYRSRKYRTRLLGAAYRHQLHWSELIGGDVVLTMPHAWQKRFNASSVEVKSRIDDPVPAAALQELLEKIPDFRRAYEEEGLRPADFDSFGPTRRTLRAFLKAYADLLAVVRDFLVPNPDLKG